jgi:heme-degrading monooxygenase HmoA
MTELLVVSFWESMDAVKRFAGPRPDQAVFYPEDEQYLVRRDLAVDHFEVVVRRDSRQAGLAPSSGA